MKYDAMNRRHAVEAVTVPAVFRYCSYRMSNRNALIVFITKRVNFVLLAFSVAENVFIVQHNISFDSRRNSTRVNSHLCYCARHSTNYHRIVRTSRS